MIMDDSGLDLTMDVIDTPQSRRIGSTCLVDLRKSPRLEVSFPAEVSLRGKPGFLVMITNISRSGLRAEGDRHMIDSLFDGEVRLENHRSAIARFRLRITDAECGEQIIAVRGRTVYARPEGGRYQVGVEFLEFEEGREVLFDYLAAHGIRK